MTRMRVYCSGPLFCPEERAALARIAGVLERAGFDTFLPHRDGIERFALGLVDNPAARLPGIVKITDAINRAIFQLDVYQIVERCDAVVFNMNGRVPDEGGVVEAAIAFAAGVPLVLYKNDARSKLGGSDNSMILGLIEGAPISDVDAVPAAVGRAIGRRAKPAAGRGRSMHTTVDAGRRIWRVIERMPAPATPREVDELVGEISASE